MAQKSVGFIIKTLIYQIIILVTLSFMGVACGDNGGGSQSLNSGAGENPDNGKTDLGEDLGICSTLNFKEVSWPGKFVLEDQTAFALGLNITGSFEGHSGWTNLSNNFDGQGFSMGLLNQNLGQGTIQPMLIEMRDKHKAVLEGAMTPDMLADLLSMLKSWERSSESLLSKAALEEDPQRFLVSTEKIGLSSLGSVDKSYGLLSEVRGSNSSSVKWAKNTLYKDSGKTFKPEWEKALRQIGGSPEYVSLQIKEAQYLHDRASDYRDRLKWTQLRAYLFLFDISVQNGTLKDKHFNKFAKWLKKNPQATEEEQLLEMLEIRVVDSHSKWQKDVRTRKTAIIKGVGFVHGEDRNLPLEYCYDPILSYPSLPASSN